MKQPSLAKPRPPGSGEGNLGKIQALLFTGTMIVGTGLFTSLAAQCAWETINNAATTVVVP